MKKLISAALAACMAASLAIVPVTEASAASSVAQSVGSTSGVTGDCQWTLNGTTLTISGNGATEDLEHYTYYDNNVSYLGEGVEHVIFEEGVTRIGESLFVNCDSIVSVSIPSTVTEISRQAFSGCSGLTEITIPGGVKSIESHAFDNCFSLESVTFSEGLESIGSWAFWDCDSLESVSFPETELPLGGSVTLEGPGLTIRTRLAAPGEEIHSPFKTYCLKYESMNGKLIVAPPRPGERYRPAGRGCTKTLKSLFAEARATQREKLLMPVFRDGKGVVLVPAFGEAERCACGEGDAALLITIEEKT